MAQVVAVAPLTVDLVLVVMVQLTASQVYQLITQVVEVVVPVLALEHQLAVLVVVAQAEILAQTAAQA